MNLRIAFYISAGAALLFRFYYLLTRLHPDQHRYSDMEHNYSVGQHIFTGQHVIQDLWKPFGYSAYLALSFWLEKIGVMPSAGTFAHATNIVLLFLLPFVMYFAAKPWLGVNRARAVALIGLLHFQYTLFAGLYMGEIIFAFILALMVLVIGRSRFPWTEEACAALGLLFGLGMLVKGQLALFAPLLMVWLWEKLPPKRFATLAGTFVLAAFLPWSAAEIFKYRNYPQIPGPAVAALGFVTAQCAGCENVTDKEGYTWGAPVFYQMGRETTNCKFRRSFSETRFFWWHGARCIAEDPGVLVTSFRNIYFLFAGNAPWPFSNLNQFSKANYWSSLLLSLFLVGGMLAGLVRYIVLKQRGPVQEALALMCIGLMILAYAIMPEIRHRMPFDVFFIPLALWGWSGAAPAGTDHHST